VHDDDDDDDDDDVDDDVDVDANAASFATINRPSPEENLLLQRGVGEGESCVQPAPLHVTKQLHHKTIKRRLQVTHHPRCFGFNAVACSE